MKKILSVTLVLTMLLGTLCIFPASAERFSNSIDYGEYWYIVLDDKTVAIGADNPDLSGTLIIPETINGYTVTEIAHSGFSGTKITEAVIPNTDNGYYAEELSYSEEYRYHSEVAPRDATPDYVLIDAFYSVVTEGTLTKKFGDYVLSTCEITYPSLEFGYYIYLPEKNEVYTLTEAFEKEIEGIYNVFTDAGIGKLIGDVNYDRKLNIKDATLIQKAVANLAEIENNYIKGTSWSLDENMPAFVADFNCDGKMNVRDATAIQKKLAKF